MRQMERRRSLVYLKAWRNLIKRNLRQLQQPRQVRQQRLKQRLNQTLQRLVQSLSLRVCLSLQLR